MNKRLLVLIALFIATFLISNCKKETADAEKEDLGDTLTEEQNAFIESISVPLPPLNKFKGSDGAFLSRISGRGADNRPYEIKGTKEVLGEKSVEGKLIERMIRYGRELMAQKENKVYPKGSNEFEPEQKGLVYSYGQKNFAERLKPTDGNDLHKKYSVYGTDCSGFVYNVLNSAGLKIGKFGTKKFQDSLEDALKNDVNYKDKVHVENLGKIPPELIKSGDFILWTADGLGHMGFICDTENEIIIAQSNGTGNPKDVARQLRNMGPENGAHPISYIKATTGTNYWGTNYSIIRIASNKAQFTFEGSTYEGSKSISHNPFDQNLETCLIKYPEGLPHTIRGEIELGLENLPKQYSVIDLRKEALYFSGLSSNNSPVVYLPFVNLVMGSFPDLESYVSISGKIMKDKYGTKVEALLVKSTDYYRKGHAMNFTYNGTWKPAPSSIDVSSLKTYKLSARFNN